MEAKMQWTAFGMQLLGATREFNVRAQWASFGGG